MAIEKSVVGKVRLSELYTGEAKCAEIGDYLFFEELNDPPYYTVEAKKICSNCALMQKCRDYAIRHKVHGVWGGTTLTERTIIRANLKIKAMPIREDVA
jgi:hypothetical protein